MLKYAGKAPNKPLHADSVQVARIAVSLSLYSTTIQSAYTLRVNGVLEQKKKNICMVAAFSING